MNWPGVARWGAIVLCVALVVLVSTSEVIARRGWWVFTTELVVPVFLGVAGAAVAVVATVVSHRSVEISKRATALEAARAERARRQPLARNAVELMRNAVTMYDVREGARRAKVARSVVNFGLEADLHDGTEGLRELVQRFASTVDALQAKAGASATDRQVASMQRSKWMRSSRAAINAWAQSPDDDGEALMALAKLLPRGGR